MKTENWQVYGRVQGVGYRCFVKNLAQKHHITGTVRNQMDGTVEIIAQGQSENIDVFYNEIQIPQHRFMTIEKVKRYNLETNKIYKTFSIIY